MTAASRGPIRRRPRVDVGDLVAVVVLLAFAAMVGGIAWGWLG